MNPNCAPPSPQRCHHSMNKLNVCWILFWKFVDKEFSYACVFWWRLQTYSGPCTCILKLLTMEDCVRYITTDLHTVCWSVLALSSRSVSVKHSYHLPESTIYLRSIPAITQAVGCSQLILNKNKKPINSQRYAINHQLIWWFKQK